MSYGCEMSWFWGSATATDVLKIVVLRTKEMRGQCWNLSGPTTPEVTNRSKMKSRVFCNSCLTVAGLKTTTSAAALKRWDRPGQPDNWSFVVFLQIEISCKMNYELGCCFTALWHFRLDALALPACDHLSFRCNISRKEKSCWFENKWWHIFFFSK